MKKLLALTMAVLMMVGLVACGSADSGADANADAAYNIGVCQLVQHVALDAATQGFVDTLNAELGEENINWDIQNAAGDSNTCNTIVNGFVSANVDLILANATPALQAASVATGSIPVLGTSVTEYGVALGIDNFDGLVGTNVSGTSDLAPLDQQAAMITEWCPDAKTVGLLYCSAEANSQYQVDEVEKLLEAAGLDCTQYPFTDSNDIQAVCQMAADNSDVIYVPTDNTVADNTGIIANIAIPANVPVIAGEEATCSGCGVATLSISYEELGQTTGEMAYEVLVKGADISAMPIQFAPSVTKKYNPTICEQMGLTPLEGYIAIETAE